MCMLVHWTGGRDIDGTCSWLSSSVHTFPPGVLVVLLHNQRKGGREGEREGETTTGCCTVFAHAWILAGFFNLLD